MVYMRQGRSHGGGVNGVLRKEELHRVEHRKRFKNPFCLRQRGQVPGKDDVLYFAVLRGEYSFPELEDWQTEEDMGVEIARLRRSVGVAEREPKDVNEILFGPTTMHRIVVLC